MGQPLIIVGDIHRFILAATVCLQLFMAASAVSAAIYMLSQNRKKRIVRHLLFAVVALAVWNIGYSVGYLFITDRTVSYILRFVAEAGMITYYLSCTQYVRLLTGFSDRHNENLRKAYKIILIFLFLVIEARGLLYPFGRLREEIYEAYTWAFRLPAAVLIILMMVYIIYQDSCWKARIRYKRGLSSYRILGDFAIISIVLTILDIAFSTGKYVDTFSISALFQTFSIILLFITTAKYLKNDITLENATRALRGDIPTPLFVIDGENYLIAAVNKAAINFLGLNEEDITGRRMQDFFDTSVDEETAMRRSLEDTKFFIDKGSVRGTKKPCRFVSNNIHDQFGEPFCAVTFVYDLSNEEEMIERLKESTVAAERANSAKGMFLANMSHEIRTPMNAIIGMAEIGLRDSTEPEVKEELRQIKAAGNGLLEIINDILDFSKIESGTLEIVNAEFESLSMINDLVNIVRQKFHDKKLEFIVRVNPHFPSRVLGDEGRIKQVLLNILNNAVKYTDEGSVKLTVDFENQDNCILMHAEIEDSGIGIKEEEQEKLFKSYHQLDVYKNRKKEGTGLGLSISKRLVDMMDGSINVSSIYGQGSTFSITIPLEVTDYAESISVNKPEEIQTATFMKPSQSEAAFRQLLKDIGIRADMQCTYPPDVMKAVKNGAKFIFIDEEFLSNDYKDLINAYPGVKIIAVTNKADPVIDSKYVKMQRPEFGVRLMSILGGEKEDESGAKGSFNYSFKAPDAKVLIVDDNAVNVSVAEGLLKPFEIQVDSVLSGEESVKMVAKTRYDIVFMDHMMPGMDGVAATRYIREDMGIKDLTIIALTANAIRGTEELLKQVGMNDFIAKPIDMNDMAGKLRKWLPKEKIIEVRQKVEEAPAEIPEILKKLDPKDVDIEQGLTYTGGDPATYLFTIKIYREEIENNLKLLNRALEQNDIRDFTIRIHALKSASRSIGAAQLADDALQLEMKGKQDDIDFIKKNAPAALERYSEYLDILKDFADEREEETGKRLSPMSRDEFDECLMTIRTSVSDFDIDVATETINRMKTHRMKTDADDKLIKKLGRLVDELEYDECISMIDEYFINSGKGQ